MHLRIDDDTRLLVLTGAGVSAESGVKTFRDSNGLWETYPVEQVATPEGFRANPQLVWRFYSERRRQGMTVHPNPGHLALAEAESRMDGRFLLVTQNVDGLHHRAGNRRLVEMHGRLFETRCSLCDRPPFPDENLYLDGELPRCEQCRAAGLESLLRPAIVWFGEMLDPEVFVEIEGFLAQARRHRLVFLAVGTSGQVYPAAGLVMQARAAGGETWLVNAEPPENVGAFENFVQGPSGRVLPELFEWT